MTDNRILVVGGTGMLGAPAVDALLAAGRQVRLLARDPAKAHKRFGEAVEVALGDVDEEAAISRALDGCVGVHISLAAGMNPADIERIEHHGTARIAKAAAKAGTPRLTY